MLTHVQFHLAVFEDQLSVIDYLCITCSMHEVHLIITENDYYCLNVNIQWESQLEIYSNISVMCYVQLQRNRLLIYA